MWNFTSIVFDVFSMIKFMTKNSLDTIEHFKHLFCSEREMCEHFYIKRNRAILCLKL